MADVNDYMGEPIPLDSGDESKSKPGASSGGDDDDLFKPVSRSKAPSETTSQSSSRIRTFESGSTLSAGSSDVVYKRSLNTTGQGACRVKTFNSKLNAQSLAYLDEQINEWLDQNGDIEVKFCNTTVGTFEAKRPEVHLILTVWY